MTITIYTDGSSRGNPGKGGYGAVLKMGSMRKEISEGFRLTTNNRMELLSVIRALQALKSQKYDIQIYSDSKYVVDSVEKGWIWNWQKKGFKGKANMDLWIEFIPLYMKYKPKLNWVKGHAGIPENERCDDLAVNAADGRDLLVDTYYEENYHNS